MSRAHLGGALALSLSMVPPAMASDAENPSRLDTFVLLGAGAAPEYEGSDSLEATPVVAARVGRQYRYLFLQGPSLRANLLNRPTIEFGPLVNYDFGRDEDVEGDAVSALGEIDSTTEFGGFIGWNSSSEAVGGGRIRLTADYRRDLDDVHDSWRATVVAGWSRVFSARWSLETELSGSVVGDAYADTYFSVSPAGSAASGLPTFEAAGGAHDIGFSLNLRYAITRRLSLSGLLSQRRLFGDAADSPIVEIEGNRDQTLVAFAIGWQF